MIWRLSAVLNSIAAGVGAVTSLRPPNPNLPVCSISLIVLVVLPIANYSSREPHCSPASVLGLFNLTGLEKALTNEEGLKEGLMNLFLARMSTLDMPLMGRIIWCEGVILGNKGKDVSKGAARRNSEKQVKAYSDQTQKPRSPGCYRMSAQAFLNEARTEKYCHVN